MGRVVDSDYRVTGIDALRVIDGSTFRDSPGTNPQATVMMLGRYVYRYIYFHFRHACIIHFCIDFNVYMCVL